MNGLLGRLQRGAASIRARIGARFNRGAPRAAGPQTARSGDT